MRMAVNFLQDLVLLKGGKMLNEETKENQTVGLGVNAYETEKTQPADGLENDEGYFGKSEYYDYSGVKLPENYCYDETLLNEFN